MNGGAGVLGAVLAGGASRRFGSPKWRAPFAGTTLGASALSALAPQTDRVVVVSSDPRTRELGHEVWPDPEPGRGPVGGIATALAGARRLGLAGVFVLACDLPLVNASLVGAVLDLRRGEDAVVPVGPGGPEPLCAFYPTTALTHVEAALAHGRLEARRLVEALAVVWLPLAGAVGASGRSEPFLNVNTPADLRRAERALEQAPSPFVEGRTP